MKLRTSHLGCPVSSLLGKPSGSAPRRRGGMYPVIAQYAAWTPAGEAHGIPVWQPPHAHPSLAALNRVMNPGTVRGSGDATGNANAQASPTFTSQVLLGANDKHLNFRSSVMVRYTPDTATGTGTDSATAAGSGGSSGADSSSSGGGGGGVMTCILADRVACHNLFGVFYMNSISAVHLGWIAPGMLRAAVEGAMAEIEDVWSGRVVLPASLLDNLQHSRAIEGAGGAPLVR